MIGRLRQSRSNRSRGRASDWRPFSSHHLRSGLSLWASAGGGVSLSRAGGVSAPRSRPRKPLPDVQSRRGLSFGLARVVNCRREGKGGIFLPTNHKKTSQPRPKLGLSFWPSRREGMGVGCKSCYQIDNDSSAPLRERRGFLLLGYAIVNHKC